MGRQYADMVMKKVEEGQVKDKMLLLQGPLLWHKWAKHEKERYCHSNEKINPTEYNAQQDYEKENQRGTVKILYKFDTNNGLLSEPLAEGK